MTSEQRAAVDEWIRQLDPPESAIPSIRRKFQRLRLSTAEIRQDMETKMSRRSSDG